MNRERSFREEDCPAHKHLEWDVDYETLKRSKDGLKSPVFKIEKQSCVLESILGTYHWNRDCVHLSLLFIGWHDSIIYTNRCWIGLKSRDGTYRRKCWKTVKKIDVQIAWGIPFSVSGTDVKRWHLTSDGHLTFFFRINVHRATAGVEACIHAPSPIPAPPSGTIREEECTTHTQVEWEVHYEDGPFLTSPVFEIGRRVYFIESTFDCDDRILVTLYSLGPPVAASSRCWLGLKCANGSYTPDVSSNVFDMREDLGLWTEVVSHTYSEEALEDLGLWTEVLSHTYSEQALEDRHLTVDRYLRIFFRLNVASTSVETCTHDFPSITAPVSGKLREERCSAHTQVEWNVPPEDTSHDCECVRSPIFLIASQHYFYLYRRGSRDSIELIRQGCSMPLTVEWQAGLRFSEVSCPTMNFSGTLNLREEFGLWTKTDILSFDRSTKLSLLRTSDDCCMTVFFRINASLPGKEAYMNDVVDVAVQVDREETDSHQDGNLSSTRGSADVSVQVDGEDEVSRECGHLDSSKVYEDRLRQDLRLWQQHPEEGNNIRRRRRAEAEARLRCRTARPKEDDGKLSISAA